MKFLIARKDYPEWYAGFNEWNSCWTNWKINGLAIEAEKLPETMHRIVAKSHPNAPIHLADLSAHPE